jgi:tetratricopeptide (TPR) repeat protein
MTLPVRNPLLRIALAFALAVAVFAALNRGGEVQVASDAAGSGQAQTTDQRIAALESVVRAQPGNANERALLADLYVQKVREGGDAVYYTRAADVLEEARRIDPRNSAVFTELGTLALARHQFRDGLEYGLRARELAPTTVKPLGVIVDAQVELGRYDAAARTLQTMLDEKPNVAAYARASYLRELRGDLPGALTAMRLAVSAGGNAPENVAYVQSLLGHLQFARGQLGAAERAYDEALVRYPGYASAQVGIARIDAARGDLDGAIERLRESVRSAPSIEALIALGEFELAAGQDARARGHLDAARAEYGKLAANGENTDTELALIEAEHGSAAKAVRLGRSAWRKAPSVRSADALGWALTNAGRPEAGKVWARRALRLGSRDPRFLFHAGIAALKAGDRADAKRWLAASLEPNPAFSPRHAPRAERALGGLTGS